MSFVDILANTLSPDSNVRSQAAETLQNAERENLAKYLIMLSQQLSTEEQQLSIRQVAGLAMKNAIAARDEALRVQKFQSWMALDSGVKSQVKHTILSTLAAKDVKAGVISAQIVAAVAAIEIPHDLWPELIFTLINYVTDPSSSISLKQATLQAIGYICEQVDPQHLVSKSDAILTAVVEGARKDGPSPDVRYAALQALYNSLEFVKRNFDKEGERNFIMQIVCEATQAEEQNVAKVAFECLVKIMSLYYVYMDNYMAKALCGITLRAMQHEDQAIANQAIEFWCTICEEEISIELEEEDAREADEPSELVNHRFSSQFLRDVLGQLLGLLSNQEDDEDLDDESIHKSAATCLSLLAQAVKDEILPFIVQYVEDNVRNGDWRFREAAVMAFGSILEGPDSTKLAPLVKQALETLIHMMTDSSDAVKDTCAWTLGKLSEVVPDLIQSDPNLPQLIQAFCDGLGTSPRVARNCAWSLANLAERLGEEGPTQHTNILSPHFDIIATRLLQAAERSDAVESNVRLLAYQALSNLVEGVAFDSLEKVAKLTTVILDKLEGTILMEANLLNSDDKAQHMELQTDLCGVLSAIIRRVGSHVKSIASRIMELILRMFSSSQKKATLLEDGLLAVGVLINALEADFKIYMDSFVPFLFAALRNHQEHQLCGIAVGLVGDLCRALGRDILPYTDGFVSALLENVGSVVLHRDVKPPILSCFGDIALAVGGDFEKYYPTCMQVLIQAAESVKLLKSNDPELVEYSFVLQEGILEAYIGIVQGLKEAGKAPLLVTNVEQMFQLIHSVSQSKEHPDVLVKHAIGLIGDLADTIRQPLGAILRMAWVEEFIKEGRQSRDPDLKKVAKYAKEMVKQALN